MTIWPPSRVLLDLLLADATELNQGRVQHLIRRGGGAIASSATRGLATAGDQYPTPVQKFLNDLLAAMKAGATATSQGHPADAAARTQPYFFHSATPPTELSAVDLAWLQRLPQDPAKVTWSDAVTLASLAAHKWPIGSPSKRLVDAAWQPVDEVFTKRKADDDLATARKPLWKIPNAVTAVAECIAHEVPALSTDEAFNRASEMVDAQLAQRRERHTQRRDDAYAAVAAIEARVARRTSKTAPGR